MVWFFRGFLVLISIAVVDAQVASRVRGTVRDSSDAVIQNVRVTLVDLDRGTTLSTLTNDVGQYSFPNVLVGDYRIVAEYAGFKKASTDEIKVDVNQSVEVNLQMEP